METKKYWINIDGQEKGPFIKEDLQKQDLAAETLVWEIGTTKWKTAKEFEWYGYKDGLYIITPGKNGLIDINGKLFGIVLIIASVIIVTGIVITLTINNQKNDSTNVETKVFDKGMEYYRINKQVEAFIEFNKAISLDENNTDAYFMRSVIKSNLNDIGGQISDLDEIIKRVNIARPTIYRMETVFNNKGFGLMELNRLDEALPYLNKSLEIEPNDGNTLNSRGEYYFKIGNYDSCISDMSKSIEISIKKPEGHLDSWLGLDYYLRGLARIKIGQKDEGCKDLSKAGQLGKIEAYKAIIENCK